MFQAALRYPFKRVIVVELSEELYRVAHENIERNRRRLRCRDVQLVNEDILTWEIPSDLTIAYMHNPFVGGLFEVALERLNAHVEKRGTPAAADLREPDTARAADRAAHGPRASVAGRPSAASRAWHAGDDPPLRVGRQGDCRGLKLNPPTGAAAGEAAAQRARR